MESAFVDSFKKRYLDSITWHEIIHRSRNEE